MKCYKCKKLLVILLALYRNVYCDDIKSTLSADIKIILYDTKIRDSLAE